MWVDDIFSEISIREAHDGRGTSRRLAGTNRGCTLLDAFSGSWRSPLRERLSFEDDVDHLMGIGATFLIAWRLWIRHLS